METTIKWTTEQIALEKLIEWEKNPVILSDHDEEQIRISLETFGFVIPLVANQPTKAGNCRLIDGHQRKTIMLWSEIAEKKTKIDVRIPSRKLTDKECDNLSLRLRRHMGRFDWHMIGKEFDMDWLMEEVGFLSSDFFEEGFGDDGDENLEEEASLSLAERFIVPPFSVLDARQGYWQDRKKAWINLGIRGEMGRGGNLLHFDETAANINFYNQKTKLEKELGRKLETPDAKERLIKLGRIAPSDHTKEKIGSVPSNEADLLSNDYGKDEAYNSGKPDTLRKAYQHVDGVLMKSDSGNDPAYYFKKQKVEKMLGRKLSTEEFQRDHYEGPDTYQSGSSIFDPVLCEIAYRWFTPTGGRILDPFAGESTKGIVATYLGYEYTGVELRKEQVEANEAQADIMGLNPKWITGDSYGIEKLLPEGEMYDLIFTSPPYYDLEIYSELDKDGSAFETYDKFMVWYGKVFEQCIGRLNDNRFVVIKIGEIRDKKTGAYRNFLGDNISCFLDLGLKYYNEAVLVTSLGSLPIRAGEAFVKSRKLGKTHQNILVFYKGDIDQIQENFSREIEYAEIVAAEENTGTDN